MTFKTLSEWQVQKGLYQLRAQGSSSGHWIGPMAWRHSGNKAISTLAGSTCQIRGLGFYWQGRNTEWKPHWRLEEQVYHAALCFCQTRSLSLTAQFWVNKKKPSSHLLHSTAKEQFISLSLMPCPSLRMQNNFTPSSFSKVFVELQWLVGTRSIWWLGNQNKTKLTRWHYFMLLQLGIDFSFCFPSSY